jgi:hypothetical protein
MRLPMKQGLLRSITLALLIFFVFCVLGRVTNNTDHDVTLGLSMPSHQSFSQDDATSIVTMVGIFSDKSQDLLAIDAVAKRTGCKDAAWRREVRFKDRVWEFYYNLGTVLNITVNSDGNFDFMPGKGGQVLLKGQDFKCQGESANTIDLIELKLNTVSEKLNFGRFLGHGIIVVETLGFGLFVQSNNSLDI